jgi:hypothetical protein
MPIAFSVKIYSNFLAILIKLQMILVTKLNLAAINYDGSSIPIITIRFPPI